MFDVADAVLGAVPVERLLVAHRVQPGRGDDHRLGLAADLVGDVVAEVLDDRPRPSGPGCESCSDTNRAIAARARAVS